MLFDVENDTQIAKLIIHEIGSNANNKTNVYSNKCMDLDADDPLNDLLKQYFFATFHEPNLYHLDNGKNDNIVFQAAASIFENDETFFQYSKVLADALYNHSQSPNIKPGDFYMALFNNIQILGEEVKCLGLFKSEEKQTFLQVQRNDDVFDLKCQEGIDIKKLDKGCLIFNVEKENGFVVSIVDKTNKEKNEAALYWKYGFLNAVPRQDNNFDTGSYLNVCNDFTNNVFNESNGVPREDQIDLKNRTLEFFGSNQTFNEDVFKKDVLKDENVISAFDQYKNEYEQNNEINLNSDFEISQDVVNDERKKTRAKSVIKLDKNFHIYIHGPRYLIERGKDEQTGMNYYKLYFSEEH